MMSPRFGHGVGQIDKVIYCVAGSGTTGLLRTIEKLDMTNVNSLDDLANLKWEVGAPMLPALPGSVPGRYFLSVAAVGTSLFAIGGSNGLTAISNMLIYDGGHSWFQGPAMEVPRIYHTSVVMTHPTELQPARRVAQRYELVLADLTNHHPMQCAFLKIITGRHGLWRRDRPEPRQSLGQPHRHVRPSRFCRIHFCRLRVLHCNASGCILILAEMLCDIP